MRFIDG